jgi:hypothetical protein
MDVEDRTAGGGKPFDRLVPSRSGCTLLLWVGRGYGDRCPGEGLCGESTLACSEQA